MVHGELLISPFKSKHFLPYRLCFIVDSLAENRIPGEKSFSLKIVIALLSSGFQVT